MSVLVCVPTDREIHSETAAAVFAICASRPGDAAFHTCPAHPTDRCRNLCVEAFVRSPHSHLLFVDSDVVPPADCLEPMLAAARPVVCGIYPIQIEGSISSSVARKLGPNVYGFFHDYPDEPFEVDAAGLGCCLIAREVFERITSPWFKFQVRDDGYQTGEDLFFFEKCAEAGIRPLALPQIRCKHHRSVELLGLFEQFRGLKRELKVAEAGQAAPAWADIGE